MVSQMSIMIDSSDANLDALNKENFDLGQESSRNFLRGSPLAMKINKL
jgi:hypothetical protein